jgi:mono/diheme cytochrome c family protein
MTQGIKAAAVVLMTAFIAWQAFAQSSGANIYRVKCAMCHGADGLAATPMAKSMKELSFKDPAMLKASDARFFASTKYGINKMPGYSTRLTDQEIKDVIAFIRTLQK